MRPPRRAPESVPSATARRSPALQAEAEEAEAQEGRHGADQGADPLRRQGRPEGQGRKEGHGPPPGPRGQREAHGEGEEFAEAGSLERGDSNATDLGVHDATGTSCSRSATTSIRPDPPNRRSARTSAKPVRASDFGGSFAQPWASTFGPDGDLYVANTENNRVDSFQPDGEHNSAFGKDVNVNPGDGVETCSTDECQARRRRRRPRLSPTARGNRLRSRRADLDRLLGRHPRERLLAQPGLPPRIRDQCDPRGALAASRSARRAVRAEPRAPTRASSPTSRAWRWTRRGRPTSPTRATTASTHTTRAPDRCSRSATTSGPAVATGFEVCRDQLPGGHLQRTHSMFPIPVHVDCRGTVYAASSGDTGVAQAFGEGKAKPGPCKLKLKKPKRKKDGTRGSRR